MTTAQTTDLAKELPLDDIDRLGANAVRMLAADMVQKANSGHPGGPMSIADFAWVLWTRHLRHDPTDPEWPNRDRFVLGGGHCSTLLYSFLSLFGYMSEEEMKDFRQWGSATPGHPECELPGVEATTGPLGQGFAYAVGMALAEQVLRTQFGENVVDHRTYVTIGDGDIQEGISGEAAALAGHHRLGRLVVFFDDNRAQIDGSTELVSSEDVGGRFLAYGWQVLYVDGHDQEQLNAALEAAKTSLARPTLIIGRTQIGKGTATREGDHKTHGAPLGDEEIRRSKEKLGLPADESFHIPADVRGRVAGLRKQLDGIGAGWRETVSALPDGVATIARLSGQPRPTIPAELPAFTPADGKVATRKASGVFLGAVADIAQELIGGAADLAGSIQTAPFLKVGALHNTNPGGRAVHFGVREFGMTALCNGIALHGGFVPFCGTFLVFADYMKPAIRMAALMDLRAVHILTHDSFCVGEDGPTHQPTEQLAMLRATPGVTVIRPADANETVEAWRWALNEADGPVALSLTRQGLPVLDRDVYPAASEIARGGYTMHGADIENPDVVLIASGSEVAMTLDAARQLEEKGRSVRVVNLASWEIFAKQPQAYQDQVLPPNAPFRLAVEAGVRHGWERWTGPLGETHCFDRYGASAPAGLLLKEFGFTADAIAAHAEEMLTAAPARAEALRAALARFSG